MQAKPAGSGVGLGIFLGLINAMIIAIGLSVLDSGYRLQMAVMVFMFGMLPAVITGAVLGWVAEVSASAPVWARRIWLVAPALLVVAVMGTMFGLVDAVLVSCIPTTAAAFWLERSTRRHADPVVPPVVAVRRRA